MGATLVAIRVPEAAGVKAIILTATAMAATVSVATKIQPVVVAVVVAVVTTVGVGLNLVLASAVVWGWVFAVACSVREEASIRTIRMAYLVRTAKLILKWRNRVKGGAP